MVSRGLGAILILYQNLKKLSPPRVFVRLSSRFNSGCYIQIPRGLLSPIFEFWLSKKARYWSHITNFYNFFPVEFIRVFFDCIT